MSPRSAAAKVIAPRTPTARTTADRAATPRPAAAAAPTAAGTRSSTAKSSASTARATARPATAKAAPSAAPARPELRVVPSEPVRRIAARAARADGRRKAPFVFLVVAMLVGTTLGLLVLNTAIAVDSIKASDLRAQNAELAQEVQTLQQDVVDRDTPAALAAAATAAGLVPAGSAAYLVIAPDGSSTLRGSGTPAPEPVKPSRVPADKD